jgi:cytochrome P450
VTSSTLLEAPVGERVRRLFRHDPEVIQDPYPLFRRLREESPVHFMDANVAIVSPHALASTVFRDGDRFHAYPTRQKNFEDAMVDLSAEEVEMVQQMITLEASRLSNLHGERHRRVRSAAHRYFTPKKVAELSDKVEGIVEQELNSLAESADNGVADIATFANRVPLLVVMEMIGGPYEDAKTVRAWGDARSAMAGSRLESASVRAAYQAVGEFRAYVRELIEEQRHASGNSTLAAALLDATQSDQLTEDELVEFYLLLLFAGHETTRNLIVNAVRSMMEHRDQWELLCSDLSLATSATEETLRYDSVAQFFPRIAACDTELGDTRIPSGTQLLPAIGAANRDPLVFDDPEDLDITRKPNPHVSFGGGVHFCLGASVTRMEGTIALRSLAARFPELELTMDPTLVPFRPNETARGPLTLEAVLGPDRGRIR